MIENGKNNNNRLHDNHTYNVSNATCTVTKYCTNCGHVAQEALGHNTKYSVIRQATCTTQGEYVYECSRCPYTTGGYISSLGHDPGMEATCTTPQTCKRCSTVLQPAGHDWELESSVHSQNDSDGYDFYRCSICQTTRKVVHNYEWVITKEAAGCQSGEMLYMCTNPGCGHALDGRGIQYYGGHNWKERDTENCIRQCMACGFSEESHDLYIEYVYERSECIEKKVWKCHNCPFDDIVEEKTKHLFKDGYCLYCRKPENPSIFVLAGSDEEVKDNRTTQDDIFEKRAGKLENKSNRSVLTMYSMENGNNTTSQDVTKNLERVRFFHYIGHGSTLALLFGRGDIQLYIDTVRKLRFPNMDVASLVACNTAGDCEDGDGGISIDRLAAYSRDPDNPYAANNSYAEAKGTIAYAFCESGAKVVIGCNVAIPVTVGNAWDARFYEEYTKLLKIADDNISDPIKKEKYLQEMTYELAMALIYDLTDEKAKGDTSTKDPDRPLEIIHPSKKKYSCFRDTFVVFRRVEDEDGNFTIEIKRLDDYLKDEPSGVIPFPLSGYSEKKYSWDYHVEAELANYK